MKDVGMRLAHRDIQDLKTSGLPASPTLKRERLVARKTNFILFFHNKFYEFYKALGMRAIKMARNLYREKLL
jgi:hypothetical protein